MFDDHLDEMIRDRVRLVVIAIVVVVVAIVVNVIVSVAFRNGDVNIIEVSFRQQMEANIIDLEDKQHHH